MTAPDIRLDDDPLWYKDAVIYELHIKAFSDANGDGVGDFQGLIRQLDFLKDLGVTALWLLPFYPSPLRDDGYDIADYTSINPDYGSLRDFKTLLREAHKRGLRVITELVINHTSDQNEWFQKSRRAKPGGAWRDFYVWSDDPEKYAEARIIFKDFETSNWTWDPVAQAYYWHRFYHHQPDLNFDNPKVHQAVLKVLDHWMGMGVDGVRLDAIPYLYEREGTNCENLPETYAYLKTLRAHVDRKHPNRLLLAEANQWPEDAVAYFGEGDSCNMAFHFPLMPRMFMALQMEDRYPIIDILEQTPAIPDNCQWAIFLRNHDELTLEMVSDEERDYMYRMYARDPKARINVGIRRRLAPLLNNDRRKIELMNVMLFTMPGTPVIYYGDELGMGDNYYLGDRDGVRTPMQWSSDRNAGFSRANPQKLYLPVVIDPEYHYESINVENQQGNKSSLLWWMKNFIAMRKRYKAFSRGSIRFLLPHNPKVLCYIRSLGDEHVLVAVNLSSHPQSASLDLADFDGWHPEEVFSRNRFPRIRSGAYTLTLNSHGYFVFSLEPEAADRDLPTPPALSGIRRAGLGVCMDERLRQELQNRALPGYLQRRGWMRDATACKAANILALTPLADREASSFLILLETQFLDGSVEFFNLILSFVFGEQAAVLAHEHPAQVVSTIRDTQARDGVLLEGLQADAFCRQITHLLSRGHRVKCVEGELVFQPAEGNRLPKRGQVPLPSSTLTYRNNTAVIAGEQLFYKVFRKAWEGVNPEVEMIRFLSARGFEHSPRYRGHASFLRGRERIDLLLLQEYVRKEKDAFQMCLDALARFFDRVLSSPLADQPPSWPRSAVEAAFAEPGETPEPLTKLIHGSEIEFLRLLGQRTGEMHLVLASARNNPDFAPENFTQLYQRSVYQSLQSRGKRSLRDLATREDLPDELVRDRERVLARQSDVLAMLQAFVRKRFQCLKIRCHGEYRLRHILHTGRDFVIVNFEGKAHKPLSERRIKRSPLRDVSELLRSLHEAALCALSPGGSLRPEDSARLAPWAELWRHAAGGAFLRAYLATVVGKRLVPEDEEGLNLILGAFLLDKAFEQLLQALERDDPTALRQPLAEILSLLEAKG